MTATVIIETLQRVRVTDVNGGTAEECIAEAMRRACEVGMVDDDYEPVRYEVINGADDTYELYHDYEHLKCLLEEAADGARQFSLDDLLPPSPSLLDEIALVVKITPPHQENNASYTGY